MNRRVVAATAIVFSPVGALIGRGLVIDWKNTLIIVGTLGAVALWIGCVTYLMVYFIDRQYRPR